MLGIIQNKLLNIYSYNNTTKKLLFLWNLETYKNIANVRDLISLIYFHKIPKWGKLNEIIYFYNHVLIWLIEAIVIVWLGLMPS